MKAALPFLAAAAASFVPSVAWACPYSSGATGCGACGSSSSLLGYGALLLVGLGAGFASIAFERRR
ncbi:MAG TPA: hypothetical protein VN894_17435 [Polyangiaceae bacterium]|nr:hypothetical protein [Polyangiaceae bacterium]